MRQPEEIFEVFGPAVVAEILRHRRRSGTLGPLLRNLNLDVPQSVEEQYETLFHFLGNCGPIEFLNQVSLTDPANTAVRRRRDQRESAGATPDVPNPVSQPEARSVVVPSNPLREEATPGSSTPEAVPDGRKMIQTETYTGPDRRSGREQRVGPADRRQNLETIFRNQRFGGGDRRKIIRRREDREAQYRKDKEQKS